MRVLIADDQRSFGMALADMVRYCGHEVVGVVGSGLEAIHQFTVHKPDLVLMDHRMPKLNGATACRHILAKDPGARIILVSGWSPSDAADESGAISYLPKPVEMNRLNAALLAVSQTLPPPPMDDLPSPVFDPPSHSQIEAPWFPPPVSDPSSDAFAPANSDFPSSNFDAPASALPLDIFPENPSTGFQSPISDFPSSTVDLPSPISQLAVSFDAAVSEYYQSVDISAPTPTFAEKNPGKTRRVTRRRAKRTRAH